MIARYEQSVLSGRSQVTVQRYMGLQNLPHWHMESELIFAQKGSAEVISENTVYPLTQGRCVFIRSGAVHYIKAEAESIITVMKIDSELLFSSATAADNRDSMAPSTAMVMATGNKFLIASQSNLGTTASGNCD